MKLIDSLKTRGLKETVQQGILKALGIKQQKEEINSLYYYLNSYCDITSLPPTQNKNLRNLQLGILELLKIFDKLCKKYNLRYWLDAGNLLGAYRHKGFVPWDDDMDVSMPREDYDKVIPLFKDELNKYGIIISSGGIYDDRGTLQRIGINYKTAETGIWIDVFPVDFIKCNSELSKIRPILDKAISEYIFFYKKNEKILNENELISKKQSILSKYDNIGKGNHSIVLFCPEFNKKVFGIDQSDLFPLKEMEFEGLKLPVPNNTPRYLMEYYGENFMSFPRTGIEHHLDPDGSTASTRAIRHGIDMEKEILFLQNVYDKI